eukprot:m.5848 g.5848  ORF g.5848 m.5848 type:complete len:145 (-) comp2495_c0_seq1:297-731(-)
MDMTSETNHNKNKMSDNDAHDDAHTIDSLAEEHRLLITRMDALEKTIQSLSKKFMEGKYTTDSLTESGEGDQLERIIKKQVKKQLQLLEQQQGSRGSEQTGLGQQQPQQLSSDNPKWLIFFGFVAVILAILVADEIDILTGGVL